MHQHRTAAHGLGWALLQHKHLMRVQLSLPAFQPFGNKLQVKHACVYRLFDHSRCNSVCQKSTAILQCRHIHQQLAGHFMAVAHFFSRPGSLLVILPCSSGTDHTQIYCVRDDGCNKHLQA